MHVIICLKNTNHLNDLLLEQGYSHLSADTNPICSFDLIVIEQALLWKKEGKVRFIEVVSYGPEECVAGLVYALAMGVDKATRIVQNKSNLSILSKS